MFQLRQLVPMLSAVTLLSLTAEAPGQRPAAALDQAPGGSFEMVLRPVRETGAEVSAIAVDATIRGATVTGDGPFSLTAPVVYPGTPGVADRVRNLVVSDAQGAIPLEMRDDPAVGGGFPYFRHWVARRPVTFPVRISYQSDVQPPNSIPNGPPFGLRPSAGGVSGAGTAFLAIPENVSTTLSRVRWDLSDLERGSIAATSFGDGAFELAGLPSRIAVGWYMAGPAGRYPLDGDDNGFSATWLGSPPWDPATEMAAAARIYRYLGQFFSFLGSPPRYRTFVRIVDAPPFGGGTAQTNSFMLSRGPAQPNEAREAPRGVLFHEMIHGFVGQMEMPVGIESWFSEGLTSYYTTQLQFRGGFHTIDQYHQAINELAESYYTNPSRDWSAARIKEAGFGNERARRVPYQRGELYFADLDARIRAASHGRRNLDSFIRDLFLRREASEPITPAVWMAGVEREAGAGAGREFQRIIVDGAIIEPHSNAFGPCLTREVATFEAGGQTFPGYRWTRISSVPADRCVAG
jgi:hypothetical protein